MSKYVARTELGRRLLRIRERSIEPKLNADEILALRDCRRVGLDDSQYSLMLEIRSKREEGDDEVSE